MGVTDQPNASEAVPALPPNADPNRFERRSLLGEGGMGVVHLAFDRLMLRAVALKTLRDDLKESKDHARDFLQEARVTAQLDHPNIVPVHELMTSDDGITPSLIMKYVEGETYSLLVERLHASPTDALLRETLQVFLKVCDAMSFAHERGIIHCDLKPENVMVGKHGQVYVMDWGVALLEGREPASSVGQRSDSASLKSAGLTHSRVGGSPVYMAPEQLRGDHGVINVTTDVYGLGGLLCVILTGKPPRHNLDDMADLDTTPPIDDRVVMTEVPPELSRIAKRALSPAQADRFQSVDELRHEMEAFMLGGGWFATRRYLAGDIIIREGDSGSEAYIISSGICDVFKGAPEGHRQLIRSMGPGETFGELSVLTRMPRSATVSARTDVSLRLVTPEALDRELERNPVLGSFMSAITTRFCELEARLAARDVPDER